MRTLRLTIAMVVGAAPLGGLAAQDVAGRLAGRVPPAVQRAVVAVVADATTRGLPVEPLIQKAIEGGAKGVPADRITAAVRTLAGRLGEARDVLRAKGEPVPSADLVEGGAEALGAGLDAGQVRDLVRASHPPYEPALTLRVAATLAAIGVPAPQAVGLLEAMIAAGRDPADLVGLPGQVLAGVDRGATPSQAAGGLGRAGGGSPPGRAPDWVPPGKRRPPNPHKP